MSRSKASARWSMAQDIATLFGLVSTGVAVAASKEESVLTNTTSTIWQARLLEVCTGAGVLIFKVIPIAAILPEIALIVEFRGFDAAALAVGDKLVNASDRQDIGRDLHLVRSDRVAWVICALGAPAWMRVN